MAEEHQHFIGTGRKIKYKCHWCKKEFEYKDIAIHQDDTGHVEEEDSAELFFCYDCAEMKKKNGGSGGND